MQAGADKLINLLRATPQFVIPIFQRPYAWTEAQLATLWKDVLETGSPGGKPTHFLGSVVHVDDKPGLIVRPSANLVIDGQQRMTSVMLLIEAVARSIGDGEPVPGLTDLALKSYYLLNMPERGERRFKLLLSRQDDQSLRAILDRLPQPSDPSEAVERNFEWFRARLRANPSLAVPLWRGIERLMVVEVKLERQVDDPQLIFESMNSTGLGLSQADLIRNFVLMRLEPERQTRLYNGYWRPMEGEFGQNELWRFDRFMRHFLTLRTGTLNKDDQVYAAFKTYALSNDSVDTETICADLRACATAYLRFACLRERDPKLLEAFSDLAELGMEPAHPLLLALCLAEAEGTLPTAAFVSVCRVVESLLFRRAVCGIPTNSLTRFFSTVTAQVGDGRVNRSDCDAVVAALVKDYGAQRFPSDEDMKKPVLQDDVYHRRVIGFWLRRLENYKSKEKSVLDRCTIEHVMPQNPEVSCEWRKELGPEWERIYRDLLHTIGNLTLTGYNSEYRDSPFSVKRDMENGFASSRLRLNSAIGRCERWDEATMLGRARKILATTLQIWPRPQVSGLAAGASTAPIPSAFAGIAEALLMALFAEVRGLAPGFDEDAQGDVVAISDGLTFARLRAAGEGVLVSLPVDVTTLEDPRRFAVIGQDGDGGPSAEVTLLSSEDIPYVARLVFQSYQACLSDA